ncbi:MAG TPA: hypothetical protein ENN19_15955 [Chloroflexi bacterium]|nr:hypothetical protein [Chloroflexota bacterium]
MAQRKRRKLTPAQKWVVALAILMWVLGAANLSRAALAWLYQQRLPDLPLTLPFSWGYLMVMGIAWGVAFTVGATGLIRFRPWGRWWTLATTTLYEVHVWINHLLFDANDYARQIWSRALALSVLLLAIVWGLLSWSQVKRVFAQPEDGEGEG